MKVSWIIVISLLLATSALAQDTLPFRVSGIEYSHMSNSQKKAARVLTGVGAGGLLITLVVDASQTISNVFVTVITLGYVEPERKSFTVPYILSGAVLLGGITLFAASRRNARRAPDVSGFIDLGRTQVLQRNGVLQQAVPVAGLKVRL